MNKRISTHTVFNSVDDFCNKLLSYIQLTLLFKYICELLYFNVLRSATLTFRWQLTGIHFTYTFYFKINSIQNTWSADPRRFSSKQTLVSNKPMKLQQLPQRPIWHFCVAILEWNVTHIKKHALSSNTEWASVSSFCGKNKYLSHHINLNTYSYCTC